MTKSKFKKILITIFIILGLIIIIDLFLKVYFNQKTDTELNDQMQLFQAQYNIQAVEIIRILENNGVEIDSKYKHEIKNTSRQIVNDIQDYLPEVHIVAQAVYLNEYYKFEKTQKMYDVLDKYYINEKKIFCQLPLTKKMTSKLNELENQSVSFTIDLAQALERYDYILNKYQVYDGLAEWYQEHIDDNTTESLTKDNLISIFWILYESGNLDKIDYPRIKPFLYKEVKDGQKILDNQKKERNLTTLFYADEVSSYKKLFENDNSYKNTANQIFSEIDTLEELQYDKNDELFVYYLAETLRIVSDPKQCNILTKNVNNCLKENYTTCFLNEK